MEVKRPTSKTEVRKRRIEGEQRFPLTRVETKRWDKKMNLGRGGGKNHNGRAKACHER